MKNYKKFILISLIIIIIICICTFVFVKKDYKLFSKASYEDEISIDDNILNINSYTAKIEVEITSNKNKNKYILEQEYKSPNIAKQVAIEPSNIEGLLIENDGSNIKISNTKLNLTKIYENYNYITNNHLFLNTFIEDYKNSNESKIEENENEIILKTTIKDNNKYFVNKNLYIDKKSNKISKMKIKDLNQNVIVYIVYNEITINSIK